MIEWAERVGENPEDIGRCRDFFDVEYLRLKRYPNAPWTIVLLALVGALLSAYMWLAVLMVVPRVWVDLPSGHHAMLGIDGLTGFSANSRLGPVDCALRDKPTFSTPAGWAPQDVSHACDWFARPKFKDEVADSLATQRRGVAYFMFALLPLAYFVFYTLTGALAAQSMAKRLSVRFGAEHNRGTASEAGQNLFFLLLERVFLSRFTPPAALIALAASPTDTKVNPVSQNSASAVKQPPPSSPRKRTPKEGKLNANRKPPAESAKSSGSPVASP